MQKFNKLHTTVLTYILLLFGHPCLYFEEVIKEYMLAGLCGCCLKANTGGLTICCRGSSLLVNWFYTVAAYACFAARGSGSAQRGKHSLKHVTPKLKLQEAQRGICWLRGLSDHVGYRAQLIAEKIEGEQRDSGQEKLVGTIKQNPLFSILSPSSDSTPSILEEIWDGTPRGCSSVIKNTFSTNKWVQIGSGLNSTDLSLVNLCCMFSLQVNHFQLYIFYNSLTFLRISLCSFSVYFYL